MINKVILNEIGNLFLMFSVFEISAARAAGLCKAEELTVFNCDLKGNHKIVSI